jgi:hypothetical protein
VDSRIEYELTETDFEAFNLQHIRTSPASVRRRRISKWAIPILNITIAAYFLFAYDTLLTRAWVISFLLLAGLWIVFYDRWYFWRVRKNLTNLLKEGSNKGLFGKYVLVLEKQTIKSIGINGETQYQGPFIQQIREDKDYLFLYISSVSAIILPKRAFYNEYEIDNAKEVFKSHLASPRENGEGASS